MQTLYTLASLEHDAEQNKKAAARILNDKLEHVLDIFTVSVLYSIRIAQYAETDASKRLSKYLQSNEDKNVDTRIAENSFVKKMTSNASFTEKIKKDKLDRFVDEEWVKKIFLNLVKTEEYARYIEEKAPTPVQEKEIDRKSTV